ncbi:fructosamine kinase [Humibacillus sp. DSM 29435]|uniref:fructosamine kinase family protein n=1 Tax=Humibacillus sp. DSM 29435 TaxID=1869167 RepID=UPI000872F920|nr:fructosamine kinase family protein [Humibacillus sp. DSM 29435]OFE16695.1 fructosamine kinase [Humibacillus sp. DSM 29435]
MEPDPDAMHRKTRPDAPGGFYAVEAAGLRWLAAAEASGGTRVVRVAAVGRRHIDVERLETAVPTARAAEDLGRSLAHTHAAGAPAFGAPPAGWRGPAWIGRQSQTNHPSPTWGAFYAEQRVAPFVRRAVDAGHLSADDARVVDRACARLGGGELDDDLPPARIHGDLWSGNVVFTSFGAVLIDPAAHGGHGLTDLAMLELFGFPELARLRAAYHEVRPLPDDWPRLVKVHQLHPLATHTASHGPSYASELVDAARSIV